jgi:hypothetical protein
MVSTRAWARCAAARWVSGSFIFKVYQPEANRRSTETS